jgi:hypothetical protein
MLRRIGVALATVMLLLPFDSRGPEERAVAIVLVQRHAHYIIQAQKHLDQVRVNHSPGGDGR